ncbi:MAG: hypothetical protein PUH24_03930 [Prevotellaceae bacterium]|nr:hypothetical protein [Prevotella sp.]MDD7257414.1 hypothetical protein [Prevotellaceae bacterium]MDY6129969.1 hypothetical protein [Prevotella sp.]
MRKALLIYRAHCFSPNSVEKDKAVLEATGSCLQAKGMEVEYVSEESLESGHEADVYLSMGRTARALAILKRKEGERKLVINSAFAIEKSTRSHIDSLMRQHGLPAAPLLYIKNLDNGRKNKGEMELCKKKYWLKRGDLAAQGKDDVQCVEGTEAVGKQLLSFHLRGINDVLITEHVEGDLVKFYGVERSGFFRIFYPTDDAVFKFDDEKQNGHARHYVFSQQALEDDAERLSALTGIRIYGGDAIVREDGTFAIIDFNDWPSFSRCCEDAAWAIAGLL